MSSKQCSVQNCSYRFSKGSEVKLFSFPVDANKKSQWLVACGLSQNEYKSSMRICSQHFNKKTDYTLRAQLSEVGRNVRPLQDFAVPSLLLPNSNADLTTTPSTSEVPLVATPILSPSRVVFNDIVNLPVKRLAKEELFSDDLHEIASTPLTKKPRVVQSTDLARENEQLRDQIKNLCEEVSELKNKIQYLEENATKHREITHTTVRQTLLRYFSPSQVRRILGSSRVVWSPQDLSEAMSLRAITKGKAYEFLRQKFPLPASSVLRQHALRLESSPGILHSVKDLMKIHETSFDDKERATVLSYDEMHLSPEICIDKKTQQIFDPHHSVQVVMARGLFKKWKQPVFYDNDKQMKGDLLVEIIKQLHVVGFTVVAVVSDLGGGNAAVKNELEIQPNHPTFKHPCIEDLNICMFADTPHLVKLLRNHFLDAGYDDHEFLASNPDLPPYHGILDTLPTRKMVDIESTSDLKMCCKLRSYHLEVEGAQRKMVKPAVQLFSNTVASGLEYYLKRGVLTNKIGDSSRNIQNLANFIHLVNDWFDVMNTYRPGTVHHVPMKTAYGIHLEEQNAVLEKMKTKITSLRVRQGRKMEEVKNMYPFQEGILMNCNSLQKLYAQMKARYGISYICTAFINQDILENQVSKIRAIGGAND